MRIAVVTLFPEMFRAVTDWGVSGRAAATGGLEVVCLDPRRHTSDRHRTVDDRPYGGGPGMVMKVAPLRATIAEARTLLPGARVLCTTPQGRRFDQAAARQLAEREEIILVAGRYEGIDERVMARDVDEEWSIGDYVLSGGELAAMVMIDAVCRLLPGTLGDAESATLDSFEDGVLDHPHYTRPEEIDGQRVPAVLLSGDHAAIAAWRRTEALARTRTRRPDLLPAGGAGPDEPADDEQRRAAPAARDAWRRRK